MSKLIEIYQCDGCAELAVLKAENHREEFDLFWLTEDKQHFCFTCRFKVSDQAVKVENPASANAVNSLLGGIYVS